MIHSYYSERWSPRLDFAGGIVALFAAPLSLLSAIEGLLVWGSWEDSWLPRSIAMASPAYVFLMLKGARRANRLGQTVRSVLQILLVALPTAAIFAWIAWIAAIS